MEAYGQATKLVGERIALRIPFLDRLDFADHDAVDSCSVEINIAAGPADGSDTTLLYGTAEYNSTSDFVYQQVEGGTAGSIYNIIATITVNGKTLQKRVRLAVLASQEIDPV